MSATHKTRDRFARLICFECDVGDGEIHDNGERFLSAETYARQLGKPDKGWSCPACGCYPCEFDDEYFELPLQ